MRMRIPKEGGARLIWGGGGGRPRRDIDADEDISTHIHDYNTSFSLKKYLELGPYW